MKMAKLNRNKKIVIGIVTAVVVISLLCPMVVSAVRIASFKDFEIAEKPQDGSSILQPFASGTGGSENFRIPAMVTLDDGTIITSADARWNHYEDSSNIDTLVSVSKDNGATWHYTFANYLGDYGNELNDGATCFIDTALATDGKQAYMVADLNPSGYATSSSMYKAKTGKTGFDEQNRLLLREKDEVKVPFGGFTYPDACHSADYDFYLDYTDDTRSGYGVFRRKTEDRVEGIEVDLFFNLTYTNDEGRKETTNIFFHNSPYQVYPTTYLYFTSTTDGLNWSAPTLLNLKTKDEQALLIGPGNGVYDEENGRLIYTAYSHTNGKPEYACLIWRDKKGAWHRSENATKSEWSSEGSVVLLDDGRLRVFYRSGSEVLKYTDFVFDESLGNYVKKDGGIEVDTGTTKTANCQLSAMEYSGGYQGKELILVSTPTAENRKRENGVIYAFAVESDGTMTLVGTYFNFDGSFGYSCIAELSTGEIAVLFETDGKIEFQVVSFDIFNTTLKKTPKKVSCP